MTAPSRGLLFIVSGPSGVGKTVLCSRALALFPDMVRGIAATSRPPRGNEQNGVDYFFLERDDMQRRIAEGAFAEWAEVHGNFYGTPRAFIDEHLAVGRPVVLNIDVQGAAKIRAGYGAEAVLFFIMPPSLDELAARLRARSLDCEAEVQRRLRHARIEIAHKDAYDHVVVNDELERAVAEMAHLMRGALAARRGRPGA